MYKYIHVFLIVDSSEQFCRYFVNGEKDAISPDRRGTKVAAHYALKVPAGGDVVVKLRLCDDESLPKKDPLGDEFDKIFSDRISEADEFYDGIIPNSFTPEQKNVSRQGYAGMDEWMDGYVFSHYSSIFIYSTCLLFRSSLEQTVLSLHCGGVDEWRPRNA